MPAMTWQEKLDALMGLVPTTCLRMSLDDSGMAVWSVDAPNRSTIGPEDLGHCYEWGSGPTPEVAVENDWELMTADRDKKIILNPTHPRLRREFRWNRTRWLEIPLPKVLRKPRTPKGEGPNSSAESPEFLDAAIQRAKEAGSVGQPTETPGLEKLDQSDSPDGEAGPGGEHLGGNGPTRSDLNPVELTPVLPVSSRKSKGKPLPSRSDPNAGDDESFDGARP